MHAVSDPLLADEQALIAPGAEINFAPGFSFSEDMVTLATLHTTTSWDSRDASPSRFEMPLLYPTQTASGSAGVRPHAQHQIAGLPGGAEIQCELISRHVDISTGDHHVVIEQFVLPDHACTVDDACRIQWVLDPTKARSDLYDLRVKDATGNLLWERAYPDQPGVVMLDTWDVTLGAYAVRVYYAELFPFARGKNDLANRLAPDAGTDFIEGQFVPIIQQTWQAQFNGWGFGQPVHPLWDEDNVVEVNHHRAAICAVRRHGDVPPFDLRRRSAVSQRRIWWYANNDAFQAYATLADAYRVVFAHEFFHLLQWNVAPIAQDRRCLCRPSHKPMDERVDRGPGQVRAVGPIPQD